MKNRFDVELFTNGFYAGFLASREGLNGEWPYSSPNSADYPLCGNPELIEALQAAIKKAEKEAENSV